MKNYNVKWKDRDGKIQIHYYQDGKLIRKSTGLATTKANIAYVQKQIIPQIQSDLILGTKAETEKQEVKISTHLYKTLEAVENKANSYGVYKIAIKWFLNYFGDRDVKNFKTLEIDSYVEHLIKSGKSPATIRAYLAPINIAFRECVRLDLIVKNPCMYIKKPKVVREEKEALNILQVKAILESNLPKDLETFLNIALFTGARAGEILALKWDCIDFTNGKLHIKGAIVKGIYGTTKSGKSRTIPLLNNLRDYLSNLPKTDGYIIKGKYHPIKKQFSALLADMFDIQAGLHITRHTFASLMLQSKESPLLVKNFLGHSDLSMINKVYAHYIEDEQDCSRFNTFLTQGA